MKKVNPSTGLVQTIADNAMSSGGAWNRDDMIVFQSALHPGLSKVPASGGTAVPVFTARSSQQFRWPHFLPDGRHLIFFVASPSIDERGVYVGSLDSQDTKRLFRSEIEGMYAQPRHLLTVRDEALVAYPFDEDRLEVTGEPSPIAEGVFAVEGAGHAGFSASLTGVLAYESNSYFNTQLEWVDRLGRRLGSLGTPDRYAAQIPQLSPDGRSVAIARGIYNREDIWIFNIANAAAARFTFDPARDSAPMWSPDGHRILFQSSRGDGRSRLYQKEATGSGSEELVLETDHDINLQDWSADGRYVMFMVTNERTRADLWILPLFGDRRPTPFLRTSAAESQAQLSPDGQWVAYTSNDTGRDEVYVESFPTAGNRHQVSTHGGVQPRWRRDGTELFFVDMQQRLTTVPVMTGTSMQFGAPTSLFWTEIPFWGAEAADWRAMYAPSADGQRFLINGRPETDPPVTFVLNWNGGRSY